MTQQSILRIHSNIKPKNVYVKVTKTKSDYAGGDYHRRDWRWAVPNDSGKYDLRPVEVIKHRPIKISGQSTLD